MDRQKSLHAQEQNSGMNLQKSGTNKSARRPEDSGELTVRSDSDENPRRSMFPSLEQVESIEIPSSEHILGGDHSKLVSRSKELHFDRKPSASRGSTHPKEGDYGHRPSFERTSSTGSIVYRRDRRDWHPAHEPSYSRAASVHSSGTGPYPILRQRSAMYQGCDWDDPVSPPSSCPSQLDRDRSSREVTVDVGEQDQEYRREEWRYPSQQAEPLYQPRKHVSEWHEDEISPVRAPTRSKKAPPRGERLPGAYEYEGEEPYHAPTHPREAHPHHQRYIEVSPGLELPLYGARETEEALHLGQMHYTRCMICQLPLYCIDVAHYVLCPVCMVVSPIEHEMESSNGGVGFGMSEEEFLEYHRRNAQRNSRRLRTYR